MSNLNVSMTIDRHRSGNSRIHGKVGNQFHDVNLWKGPQPGDSRVEGEQNGEVTDLRHNSAFSEDGHGIFGRIAGVSFKGDWNQESGEGDVKLMLNKATLQIDQDPATGNTEVEGTRLQATCERVNEEGDEQVALLCDGQRINFSVDRQPEGHIELRGRSGQGPFQLKMQRKGQDGDLRLSGKLPEQLALFPVMWELFGDDSKETPEKPLSVGAAASLAAFWGTQLS
jgi:hypothetical protein